MRVRLWNVDGREESLDPGRGGSWSRRPSAPTSGSGRRRVLLTGRIAEAERHRVPASGLHVTCRAEILRQGRILRAARRSAAALTSSVEARFRWIATTPAAPDPRARRSTRAWSARRPLEADRMTHARLRGRGVRGGLRSRDQRVSTSRTRGSNSVSARQLFPRAGSRGTRPGPGHPHIRVRPLRIQLSEGACEGSCLSSVATDDDHTTPACRSRCPFHDIRLPRPGTKSADDSLKALDDEPIHELDTLDVRAEYDPRVRATDRERSPGPALAGGYYSSSPTARPIARPSLSKKLALTATTAETARRSVPRFASRRDRRRGRGGAPLHRDRSGKRGPRRAHCPAGADRRSRG